MFPFYAMKTDENEENKTRIKKKSKNELFWFYRIKKILSKIYMNKRKTRRRILFIEISNLSTDKKSENVSSISQYDLENKLDEIIFILSPNHIFASDLYYCVC